MSELDYNAVQIATGKLQAKHTLYLIRRGASTIQAEAGLAVDGDAGPATRAAIDALLNPTPESPHVPQGKGMFIRRLSTIGSRTQMLTQMADVGLDWVAIQRIWQYANKASTIYNKSRLNDYASGIREAGRDVWIWGYPVPGKHEEFVDNLITAATESKAQGVILDPEKPFFNQGEAAKELMATLMPAAESSGLGVGFTSYGAPWNFPSFPWSEFLPAHFGMPQIYDAKNNLGPGYPNQSVAKWKDLGFNEVVPISAAFNKTQAQMASILASTPTNSAISWWDWYNCSLKASRWDAIRAFSLE